MKTLYIIRGVSGSGKSTYALTLWQQTGFSINEADQFFEGHSDYLFEPKLLPYAHQRCLAETAWCIYHEQGAIVSNTFTTNWELEKYFKLKETFPDLKIHVIEMKTQYQNVHGVPDEKVAQMKRRWEDINQKYFDDGTIDSIMVIE